VLEKYPTEVKLVLVNYPLSMHAFARKAAIAALAASRQAKFPEMRARLFASQRDLSDAKVDAIARELGLDMEKFNRDLSDPAIASLIDRDIKSGQQANVQGTPTIFINGKVLNQRSLEGFQQAIDGELKKIK
jgi:protein-disulfide isomerase